MKKYILIKYMIRNRIRVLSINHIMFLKDVRLPFQKFPKCFKIQCGERLIRLRSGKLLVKVLMPWKMYLGIKQNRRPHPHRIATPPVLSPSPTQPCRQQHIKASPLSLVEDMGISVDAGGACKQIKSFALISFTNYCQSVV